LEALTRGVGTVISFHLHVASWYEARSVLFCLTRGELGSVVRPGGGRIRREVDAVRGIAFDGRARTFRMAVCFIRGPRGPDGALAQSSCGAAASCDVLAVRVVSSPLSRAGARRGASTASIRRPRGAVLRAAACTWCRGSRCPRPPPGPPLTSDVDIGCQPRLWASYPWCPGPLVFDMLGSALVLLVHSRPTVPPQTRTDNAFSIQTEPTEPPFSTSSSLRTATRRTRVYARTTCSGEGLRRTRRRTVLGCE
jgi:hypothetical protein